MKLDLLYEIQPKIGPAYASFPDGQRRSEQEAYREAIEQIQFADKLGFTTVWCVEHHFGSAFRRARPRKPCSAAWPSQRRTSDWDSAWY